MIAQWEEFAAGPTQPISQRIHITLSPKSVILLNPNIYEQMGKPEAVMLMFDKVHSMIGLRPTRATRPGAFPVRLKPGSRHRIIRAATFCRHYGIRVTATTSFVEPEIDTDGILRLDLRKTYEVTKRRFG